MRGLQPNAQRLRETRLLAGFTQAELAQRAGVAERTIRNAEAGRPIRQDFLQFIAGALGVQINELAAEQNEPSIPNGEQENADNIAKALEALALQRNLSESPQLIASQVKISIPDPNAVPFQGEYRGVDGMRRLMYLDADLYEYEGPVDIREIRADANLVIISGVDHIRIKATNKTFSPWWHHIYQFEEGRIVRIDDLIDTAAWVEAMTP